MTGYDYNQNRNRLGVGPARDHAMYALRTPAQFEPMFGTVMRVNGELAFLASAESSVGPGLFLLRPSESFRERAKQLSEQLVDGVLANIRAVREDTEPPMGFDGVLHVDAITLPQTRPSW